MFTDKTTARIVGVLFIVASATAIVGGFLLLPLEEANYLEDVAADQGRVVVGMLLEVVLALSVVGIAVMIFPVLRRQNEGLALGYVGARILEAVLVVAATVSALLVLSLSQDYGQAGAAGLEPVGAVLLAARDLTYVLGAMVMLGVAALILYSLLYRSKLVPAWLSVWGLVGAVLILVRALLEISGVELSAPMRGLLTAPIGINEMVLAVWLIVKGFDTTAFASD